MIVQVIVDVQAQQTDRLYDYRVPDEFVTIVRAGMRVIVPFGPRKVQGFVIRTSHTSTVPDDKLRAISDLTDLSPPLTDELLALSEWVRDHTVSYHISVLKSMLPAAMRAKYRKKLILKDDVMPDIPDQEQERIYGLMKDGEVADWDKWKKSASQDEQKQISAWISAGLVSVEPVVSTGETVKKLLHLCLIKEPHTDLESYAALEKRSPRQAEIVRALSAHDSKCLPVKELKAGSQMIRSLTEKGWVEKKEVSINRDPYSDRDFEKTHNRTLMPEQQEAFNRIVPAVHEARHEAFLIRGVTGSGKTEIYLQTIEQVLLKGKEAIMLVPEISLTPQMVTRFKERFGSRVAVLHSALSSGEKYDEWHRIRKGEVDVAVGARSAVFAPFEQIGIIIIDEEHEGSYKQEDNPRYHARDVALKRGELYNCPVILGSATPSLESYARAKKGVYTLIEMEKRVNDVQMPDVEIIDMKDELRSGNRSMFSEKLLEAMKQRIDKQEQIVLFLNRRGYSTFIMCRDCGFVAECPHCDISLTFHQSTNQLQCHYCGYHHTVPRQCPECTSESIRFFGTGTQKVEDELRQVLPDARVIRMDVDTTGKKGSHEKHLTAFGNHEADILLGTQMIAKGLDFPDITLVGVLAADSMLHLPDFRAGERTFQLLTQVSGRAGRHEKHGEVLVQTYTPDHYSIQDVVSHDYIGFFQKEMRMRKQAGYPPYYFLTLIHVSDESLDETVKATEAITRFLKEHLSDETKIYGPVASSIPRIKDRYRYQCMIKYKVEPKLTAVLQQVFVLFEGRLNKGGLQIAIDTNPNMML
ncbi:primosomal protein N' [Salisediminibacterium selenitireducens]|uniref:Replication restart protein PriA n=1 Tax=Bacillus selenitireducens (strain ATCC 700615 / DSM 15326 / MLS10) TaxID=439292 RepID=D6XTR3_BACIE|nr:primosomal protein N' [Salisediminibacterium selenitireducens]ADH99199.1 primosomal protein N' [[Bacillus] selenitireducens MLS10]